MSIIQEALRRSQEMTQQQDAPATTPPAPPRTQRFEHVPENYGHHRNLLKLLVALLVVLLLLAAAGMSLWHFFRPLSPDAHTNGQAIDPKTPSPAETPHARDPAQATLPVIEAGRRTARIIRDIPRPPDPEAEFGAPQDASDSIIVNRPATPTLDTSPNTPKSASYPAPLSIMPVTRPSADKLNVPHPAEAKWPRLKFQGVMRGATGRHIARVNDLIVGPGDRVSGVEVISIGENQIEFEFQGQRMTLEFGQHLDP